MVGDRGGHPAEQPAGLAGGWIAGEVAKLALEGRGVRQHDEPGSPRASARPRASTRSMPALAQDRCRRRRFGDLPQECARLHQLTGLKQKSAATKLISCRLV